MEVRKVHHTQPTMAAQRAGDEEAATVTFARVTSGRIQKSQFKLLARKDTSQRQRHLDCVGHLRTILRDFEKAGGNVAHHRASSVDVVRSMLSLGPPMTLAMFDRLHLERRCKRTCKPHRRQARPLSSNKIRWCSRPLFQSS